jgi:hypothetical protein
MPNVPDDPKLAIHVGQRLCEELLEPLNATFGRIAVRSAYRSPTVNALVSSATGRASLSSSSATIMAGPPYRRAPRRRARSRR